MSQSIAVKPAKVTFAAIAIVTGVLSVILFALAALCLVAYLQGADAYNYAEAGRNAGLLCVALLSLSGWSAKRAQRAA